MIRDATLYPDVAAHILDIFARIFKTKDICKQAAVRSSAVGEDRLASFAGQYKTVLNVSKEQSTRGLDKVSTIDKIALQTAVCAGEP